jgi:hypothetical protein
MKRILIFALLLIHFNFSVFIPQFDEIDRIDKNGIAVDDINSLSEFIYEVVLGHTDNTPDDEDNDQPRYLHVLKCSNHFYESIGSLEKEAVVISTVRTDHVHTQEKITSASRDITSPPPKA